MCFYFLLSRAPSPCHINALVFRPRARNLLATFPAETNRVCARGLTHAVRAQVELDLRIERDAYKATRKRKFYMDHAPTSTRKVMQEKVKEQERERPQGSLLRLVLFPDS